MFLRMLCRNRCLGRSGDVVADQSANPLAGAGDWGGSTRSGSRRGSIGERKAGKRLNEKEESKING